MFFCRLLIVLIIKNQEFSMKSMSNSLDPYGSRNFVGPDLGPNYLHQQTTLVGKELIQDQCHITLFLIMSEIWP